MRNPTITYLGLSRLQFQTLKCLFPIRYSMVEITAAFLEKEENIKQLVSTEGCIFINPQKLNITQLQDILFLHEYAKAHTHAALLVFTNPFTAEQALGVSTKSLYRVNLIRGLDNTLLRIVKHLKKACTPCSPNFTEMAANMFNDGWYFIDIETSGFDPLDDDIISLSVSYMANYQIKSVQQYYVKPRNKIPENIEELTGITNEMLDRGISKAELVKILKELPSPSPLIFYSDSYFVPFLKATFMSCGESFHTPYIAMDELVAHVFEYMNYKSAYDILEHLPAKRMEDEQKCDYLEKLYRLTLATFDSLENRYGIRSMGELEGLYEFSKQ